MSDKTLVIYSSPVNLKLDCAIVDYDSEKVIVNSLRKLKRTIASSLPELIDTYSITNIKIRGYDSDKLSKTIKQSLNDNNINNVKVEEF